MGFPEIPVKLPVEGKGTGGEGITQCSLIMLHGTCTWEVGVEFLPQEVVDVVVVSEPEPVRELPSGVQDLPALVPRDDLQVHLTWRENGYRILKTYSKRYPFNC